MTDDQEGPTTVLMFNLAHDVLVKFRDDGSCTLQHFDAHDDAHVVQLDQRAQLLLLDALCDAFSFTSPIASVVTKKHIRDDEPVEPADIEPQLDLSALPSLDNVLDKEPHHD